MLNPTGLLFIRGMVTTRIAEPLFGDATEIWSIKVAVRIEGLQGLRHFDVLDNGFRAQRRFTGAR